MDTRNELIEALGKADSELYKRLQKKRAYLKGRVTMIEKEIEQPRTRAYSETTLHSLENYHERFEAIQDELDEKFEAIEDCADEKNIFENRYLAIMRKLKQSLIDMSNVNNPQPSTSAGTQNVCQTKLPDINVPTFDGSIKNWLSFRNCFDELVGKRNIDNVSKFRYLETSCIGGSASHLVNSTPNSDYVTAWSKLEDKYSNDAQLKTQLVSELYNAPKPKEDDPKSLQAFLDCIDSSLSYLQSLDVNTKSWEILLVFHLSQRLDVKSRTELEKQRKATELMSTAKFLEFLKSRIRMLEAVEDFKPKHFSTPRPQPAKEKLPMTGRAFSGVETGSSEKKKFCAICQAEHSIFECEKVKSMSVEQRMEKVKEMRLCYNCLRKDHRAMQCQGRRCLSCGGKHHTILHRKKEDFDNQANKPNPSAPILSEPPLGSFAANTSTTIVVLATAVVLIEAENGTMIPCKAFLDSGSSVNFITTHLANKLGLQRYNANTTIVGANGQESINKYKVITNMTSRYNDYTMHLDFLVSRRIVGDLPTRNLQISLDKIPPNVNLADPGFCTPSPIDLLLGAEIFYGILIGNATQIDTNLWLYQTQLGSIVCGSTNTNNFIKERQCTYVAIDELKDQIKLFWESESVGLGSVYSLEEKATEKHYVDNVKRRDDNHYEVALPVNDKLSVLGKSAERSKAIYLAAERRRRSDTKRNNAYNEFMEEMLKLKHMEEASDEVDERHYYMIHHMIARPASTTTKFRVVFNASFKTSSGISLNDALMVGPTIQREIFVHLIRWRERHVGLSADITKMYRQIYVRQEDRDLQRIWWRKDFNSPVKSYRLNTVTYGTASAPFQAIRTLKQLASDEVNSFPEAAPMFESNFYVDDFVSSFDDEQIATKMKNELVVLAKKGGFELRKWSSNVPSLTDEMMKAETRTTILGVPWQRDLDSIPVTLSSLKPHQAVTRSTILSEIAQLCDPLGLASPVVLKAKVFMQQLWTLSGISWDEQLPEPFLQEWAEFRNQLLNMACIDVPRRLGVHSGKNFELHGFADASDVGFGACIYLVSTHTVRLICAKSRVSPLKKLTTPRLELNAALLLAQLMTKVRQALLSLPFKVYLWSDSEITIFRIRSHPAKFNVYVGTRVAEIQNLTNISDWVHVPTNLNPADIVSRGLFPIELKTCMIWWNGPSFLKEPAECWPSQAKFDCAETDSELKQTSNLTIPHVNEVTSIISRFSSYTRLLNSIAIMFRFFLNSIKPLNYRQYGPVNLQEKEEAVCRVVKFVQNDAYQKEIQCIQSGRALDKKSSLLSLNPFIDVDGVLRVGGRLRESGLTFDQQHQIILPKCYLSTLILRELHTTNLHCGPQVLVGTSRQKWWIVGVRNEAKRIVHKCVPCFRHKPILLKQIMGHLPSYRVRPCRPFQTTGLDFAGPFLVRPQPRSKTLTKVYVCLFSCLVTRAVHLELVNDLSTKLFLDALRRFISRRGRPSVLLSDNATNFVGGRNELKELRDLFLESQHTNATMEFCTDNGIQWQTIPPRSPHFGGAWESMVKAFKYHLKRATNGIIFDYEGLETIMCQIECVLNSRPLTVISSSGDDYNVLTPGHFLIGEALNLLPEPSWEDINVNRLQMWQHRQAIVKEIWTKFYEEYIHELQKRNKWKTETPDIKLNQIVIIHEDNLRPGMWKYGRIVELHRGPDGKVRVVTVRTQDSTYVRPIVKIAPLPEDDDEDF